MLGCGAAGGTHTLARIRCHTHDLEPCVLQVLLGNGSVLGAPRGGPSSDWVIQASLWGLERVQAIDLEALHDVVLHRGRVDNLFLDVELAPVQLVEQDLGASLLVLLRGLDRLCTWSEVQLSRRSCRVVLTGCEAALRQSWRRSIRLTRCESTR